MSSRTSNQLKKNTVKIVRTDKNNANLTIYKLLHGFMFSEIFPQIRLSK